MDAVILFSHGSVLCGSGEALFAHAERLRERLGEGAIVEVGYLNYTQPPFQAAVAACVARGASRIVILPYFLVPGKFMTTDLPAAIAAAAAIWPHVEFVTCRPIGYDNALADTILASAAEALPPERWREDYSRASGRCIANPKCPLYNTPACPSSKQSASSLSSGEGKSLPRTRSGGAEGQTCSTLTALLVIAHGSPRAAANDELYRVLEECRSRSIYATVREAFLECNEPAVPTAIALCAEAGAEEIVAVPYFLHTGKHEANDIPTLLEEAMVTYPAIRFRMGRYIGSYPEMTEILLKRLGDVVGSTISSPSGRG